MCHKRGNRLGELDDGTGETGLIPNQKHSPSLFLSHSHSLYLGPCRPLLCIVFPPFLSVLFD